MSQTAIRKKYEEQFVPPPEVVANLEMLCRLVLEPLRRECGPLRISSGYRCHRLNKAVGGAPNSQHLVGKAADIESVSYSNALLFKKIVELGLPFDQLIWEYGTAQEPAWVHVSYNGDATNRRQVLYVPKR